MFVFNGAGVVSQLSRGKQRTLSFMKAPPPLTVRKVFANLREIAGITGGKVRNGRRGTWEWQQ